MKEIIKKSRRSNNLEIKLIVPLKTKRHNPYDEDYEEEMNNIIGLIKKDFEKCGFAYKIDMSYKGKSDQWTDYFYLYNGGIDDFKKLCKKLSILTLNI